LNITDLNAIAISSGPGSYTGLRIATSLAKGLCYPFNTPLISLSSLLVLAEKFIQENRNSMEQDDLICPLMDARRMDVFTAVYSSHGEIIFPPAAIELQSDFLIDLLNTRRIHFIGNGASKLASLIHHPNANYFPDFKTSSSSMSLLAFQKFLTTSFEDLAYFEPDYLKEAFITPSKPKIL
jgi:tRNA threonylcarbamoyladenosine biosynthesis protein TsaB